MAFWGFLFSHQEDAVLISVLTVNPRPSQAQGEAVREPCSCYDYRASQQSLVPKKGKRGLGSDKERSTLKKKWAAYEGRGQ